MLRILAASLLAIGMMQSAVADNHRAGEESADQPLSLDGLAAVFGWDLAGAQITSEKVADGLYVLFGVDGNIGVSIGCDGALIVDDQFPQVMEKIEAAIWFRNQNAVHLGDVFNNSGYRFVDVDSGGGIDGMIGGGKTLQEVMHAKPTADFDQVYGPEMASLGFANRVYTSLSQQ